MRARGKTADAAIPLAFRVPNPPPTFVGREPELRAIRAAARRGVVVVTGVGGIGKTSIVLAALKKHFPARLRAAVLVGLRPQPLQQTLVEILRALAVLAGRRDAFSAMAAEADLLALALDLAEEHEAVVVLDDLHHGGIEVLLAAARYARRSLWMATSRVAPEDPELAGQIVPVGPLPDGKLASLARLLAPRTPSAAVRDAVRFAAGSPFRLRRSLLGESQRDDAARSPLDDLDPLATRLLGALAASERTLDAASLARLVSEADIDATLGELARRGLVEVRAGGVRLHDVAAPWVAERLAPEAKAEVARALAASPHASEVVEGLRLLLAIDEPAARSLLDARGAALVRAGYAPTLWTLLRSREGWDTWKLRVAVQVANVDVTRALAPPTSPCERLLWIRALLVGGRLDDAEREARELASSSRGDIAFWAGLLGAMAVHHRTDPERGLAAIRTIEPPAAAARTLRDAIAAFWLAECGDPDGALALLATATGDGESDVDVLGAPTSFYTRYYRMAALMESGHLDEAHAAMTKDAPADLGEELSAARVAGNALANLALARGHLGEARARLGRLARAAAPAGLADVTALLALELRVASGELADIEADLERLAGATRDRTPLVHAWCMETRERVLALFARPCDAPLELAGLPLGPGTRGIVTLRRAIREVRLGGAPSLGPAPRDVEGAILHAMASRDPARAIELASRHGWAIRELEARALAVELRFASRDDATDAALAYEERARAIGSARFVLDAELLARVARGDLDASRLEAIADAIDVSPVAARRARALLGAHVALDVLDAAVVAAARLSVKVVGDARTWRRGWGLDLDRKVLWREDGTTESLARHGLYVRILEALASRGGSASFEDLARDAWNVRSFHPLQDGNRLRVTMHRIRGVVGSERIVLRDAGYALAGPPFRVISSSG